MDKDVSISFQTTRGRMHKGNKVARRSDERLAIAESSRETPEDSLERYGPQERTRRMIMAAVRLWEIKRGLSDA